MQVERNYDPGRWISYDRRGTGKVGPELVDDGHKAL